MTVRANCLPLVVLVVPEVARLLSIPVVIMFVVPALALPVAFVESPGVVSRSGPASTLVRRTRPVAVMPFVVVPDWIPIPIDPHKAWPWRRRWWSVHDARRRRRPDGDANRHLGVDARARSQNHENEYRCRARKPSHRNISWVSRCCARRGLQRVRQPRRSRHRGSPSGRAQPDCALTCRNAQASSDRRRGWGVFGYWKFGSAGAGLLDR